MKEATKKKLRKLLQPIINLLLTLNLSPNFITLLGILFAFIGFFFFWQGRFFWGGIILIIISLLDTMDGELARQKNSVSPQGAFLDSVTDRLVEFLTFFGLFGHYLYPRPHPALLILTILTLFTSLFVSYVRARAEGIGRECRIGLFERPVRFFFLVIGSLFFPRYFPYFLLIILIGNIITIFQRLIYILK